MDEKKKTLATLIDEGAKAGKKYILFRQETRTIQYGMVTYHLYLFKQTLWRIVACRDFGNVKKGDFGGLVESEGNLSHDGDCWLYDNACAYDDARVCENVTVEGDVAVCGHAQVFGKAFINGYANVICGNAKIYGKARIVGCYGLVVYGNVQIFDDAVVRYGSPEISGDVKIYGQSEVGGNGVICGSTEIFDDAEVIYNGRLDGVKLCGDMTLHSSEKNEQGIYCIPIKRTDDWIDPKVFPVLRGNGGYRGKSCFFDAHDFMDYQKYLDFEASRGKKYILYKQKKITRFHAYMWQIMACRDFIADGKQVKKGDLGGFVESEENLSQEGDAWIGQNGYVFENAYVYENGFVDWSDVHGNATVHGNAEVLSSDVYGNAEIFDWAVVLEVKVYENAKIYDFAHAGYCGKGIEIHGDARVHGKAVLVADKYCSRRRGLYWVPNPFYQSHMDICGEADIYGSSEIWGDAVVKGKSIVRGSAHVYDNAVLNGTNKRTWQYDDEEFVVVEGYSKVHGNAVLTGKVTVTENAEIYENAKVEGLSYTDALAEGNSKIHGDAFIRSPLWIADHAEILGKTKMKDMEAVSCVFFNTEYIVDNRPFKSEQDYLKWVEEEKKKKESKKKGS